MMMASGEDEEAGAGNLQHQIGDGVGSSWLADW